MSYDFRLFRAKAGEDPLITAQADSESPRGPRDPAKEELKKRTASALIARNPKLEIFKFQYDKIAEFEKTTVEQAVERNRHIEINEADGKNGIQIILFDDEASVTVPYWHKGDKARAVFEDIWQSLQVIVKETGYLAYDPQLDRIVDLQTGMMESLDAYGGTTSSIHKRFGIDKSANSKPWWRFW